MHKPVLLHAVCSGLALEAGSKVLDGTVGSGGHAEAMLKIIGPSGLLIGLDQDQEAIERTEERLRSIPGRYILKRCNFRHLDQALLSLNIQRVNAVLLDIGVSSEQLENASRGFSFQEEGPLDMRMNQTEGRSAAQLVARTSREELAVIFHQYGEERRARQIAEMLVRERTQRPIATTRSLAQLIENITPARFRFGRVHPATRVFQALRIAVNDVLGSLEEALPKALRSLRGGGRLAVISFHSLEDRIVKHFFVESTHSGEGRIMTKKPLRASDEEIEANPRSRSAKLRVLERTQP